MLFRALMALVMTGLVARVFGARSATLVVSAAGLGAAATLGAGAGFGVATRVVAFGALTGLGVGLPLGILYYFKINIQYLHTSLLWPRL